MVKKNSSLCTFTQNGGLYSVLYGTYFAVPRTFFAGAAFQAENRLSYAPGLTPGVKKFVHAHHGTLLFANI